MILMFLTRFAFIWVYVNMRFPGDGCVKPYEYSSELNITCMKWQNWTQTAMSLFTVRSKVGSVSMQSFRQQSRKSEWHVSTSSTLFTCKQYNSLYLLFHSIKNYSTVDSQCSWLTGTNRTNGIYFQCKICL